MKIIGVVIEANPLHHGHEYFLNKIKKDNPNCLIIGIVSSYFTMRGDLNCLSKKEKVTEMLTSGFDLVFELPIGLALHRADIFASNAVNILKILGITDLAFGCETANVEEILKVVEIVNLDEFKEKFGENITQVGYKNAYVQALSNFVDEDLVKLSTNPNFTLALYYLDTLKNTNINPIVINRRGSYNEEKPTSSITSATAVRNLLYNKEETSEYTSFNNYLDYFEVNKKFFDIVKFNLIVQNKRLPYDEEGIGNYIANTGDFSLEYPDFIKKLSNKKYTKTRIRRYLINLVLDNTLPTSTKTAYLRLLGFTENGINYIKELPKYKKEMIFSSPNTNLSEEIKQHLELELKGARIYGIIGNIDIIDEYKFPIKYQKEK